MKLIMNKKNSAESISLDLESSTTVHDLLCILYEHRSKHYAHFTFLEYQKFISVYECVLYGERFKNKLLPGTNLADYKLEDPCSLVWEEFTENQCLDESIDRRLLFWKVDMNRAESEKKSWPADNNEPTSAPI